MILKKKETYGYQESTRQSRCLKNTRTHGIEIAHQIVYHPIAKQAIQQQGHLSVWDFAGQHEYYNNHHYFLQSRSIFPILSKVSMLFELDFFPLASSFLLLQEQNQHLQ